VSNVVYLKNHKIKPKPNNVNADILDKLEANNKELNAACDILDKQLELIGNTKQSLHFLDYLLLAVSMFLIYLLPIYLSIPVMLVTIYLLNK